jgi:hypothetical protein
MGEGASCQRNLTRECDLNSFMDRQAVIATPLKSGGSNLPSLGIDLPYHSRQRHIRTVPESLPSSDKKMPPIARRLIEGLVHGYEMRSYFVEIRMCGRSAIRLDH